MIIDDMNKLFSDFIPTDRLDSPWSDIANDGDKAPIVYVYDFKHNPLGCGYVSNFSDDALYNFMINIEPFDDGKIEDQPSYEKLTRDVQKEEYYKHYDIIQHVNFQQKFIAIFLKEIDN